MHYLVIKVAIRYPGMKPTSPKTSTATIIMKRIVNSKIRVVGYDIVSHYMNFTIEQSMRAISFILLVVAISTSPSIGVFVRQAT
jgi:hypothetical protein